MTGGRIRHENKERGEFMGDCFSCTSRALSNHGYPTMRPKKITTITLVAAISVGTLLTFVLTTRVSKMTYEHVELVY